MILRALPDALPLSTNNQIHATHYWSTIHYDGHTRSLNVYRDGGVYFYCDSYLVEKELILCRVIPMINLIDYSVLNIGGYEKAKLTFIRFISDCIRVILL